MLLNMITTSLYLGLPLLWSGMMAWAGVKVGRSISAVGGEFSQRGQEAGRQGAGIGKAVAARSVRR
jgi:hypothetical protein